MTASTGARPTAGSGHGDILGLIRATPNLSRSDIARETGLALSTASLRVDALIQARLVAEVGPLASRGGRRAIGLTIDSSHGALAVLDIAPAACKVVLADFQSAIIASEELPQLDLSDPGDAVAALWKRAERLAGRALEKGVELAAVVVIVSGPVEYPTGIVMSPAALPGWHGFSVKGRLRDLTPLPVIVENNAHLRALGEYLASGKTAGNLISVSIGDHIGSGMMVRGRLHRGAFGAAGEIGHNSVAAESVVGCTCSAPNCLESTASARAIAVQLERAGSPVASVEELVSRANGDDLDAIDAVRRAGRLIGQALAAVVNFFDPDSVILCGPLSQCVPMVRAVRAEVFDYGLPLNTAQLAIKVSTTGEDGAVLGAIELGLEHLLSPSRIDELLSA